MCLGHSSKIPAVRVMTDLSAQASGQTFPVHNLLAFRAGACYREKPVFSSYSLWFVTGALAFPVCRPGEAGFSFLWLRHWRASNGVVRTRGTARVLSAAQTALVKDFRQDQTTKKQRVKHCFFAFFCVQNGAHFVLLFSSGDRLGSTVAHTSGHRRKVLSDRPAAHVVSGKR